MKFKIRRKKYNVKGKLAWEYNALHNLESIEYPNSDGSENSPQKILKDFDTDKLTLSINHPVDIECQPSYDGSTNIIFNDDYNVPRIVNSAFSLLEDNSYERVSRNQIVKTNIYRESSIDSETRLQRTTSTFLNFNLISMSSGGQLPGGNYVFLAQYADDDNNKTAVVAESGIVSVFNGHYQKPETINGTLLHENTNKQIRFELNNVDTSFSKIYISYRRDFCDLNGVKQSEFKMLEQPYEIKSKKVDLVIDGFEQSVFVSYDDLVAKRNIYQKIKTHTQNQNMLFFGNVEENYDQVKLLQSLALYIQVQPVYGDSIGWLNYYYKGENGTEYHNPINIYNNLGYAPEEYYRIGVVFIYNDDSRSSVYNLRGCEFEHMYSWNHVDNVPSKGDAEIDINELFIGNTTKNTKGVFRMPYVDLHATNSISPINLNFYIPPYISSVLKTLNIKGYYFVRQRRIPIFLAQGYSIGISDYAHSPLLSASIEGTPKYRLDSIIKRSDDKLELVAQKTECSDNIKTRALICPDAIMEPQLQSLFSGERFNLKKVGEYQAANLLSIDSSKDYKESEDRKVNLIRRFVDSDDIIEKELVYIPENTPFRSYKNCTFSTKVGSSVDIKSLRSIEGAFYLNSNCVRGEFIPFLGVSSEQSVINELDANSIYNIYTNEYGNDKIKVQQAIRKRAFDRSEFTSICDPISVDTSFERNEHVVARGDCFTCISSHKFTYNFLDQNTPLNEIQVKGYVKKGVSKKNQAKETVDSLWNKVDTIDASAWNEFNVSDANAVDFGHYITLKYMSNFNHSIRSVDQQKIDELSLYGSPRTFIPFGGDVTGIAFKIPETKLHNAGLSSTRTVVPHFEALQLPYVNSHFDTRIAFSNVSSTSSFANGYRVFSGVSYQDIERTYGAIVKLLPLGANLFCIFEHGCGIIPVNEKALLSTTTGQSIHLYGTGVLQEQVTVISPDYGSTWEESIIVTPNGIYGVDTWAKKIWRYNANGFELISDQLVQRYLNDNVTMTENDWTPTVALKNVKTHYNAYKGDVMFTFYRKGVEWNLCYNERINKFTTRYSWVPLLSDNIQNSFVSIDRKAIEPLALIAETQELKRGIIIPDNAYKDYLFDYKKEWTLYENIGVDDVTEENSSENASEGTSVQENVCKFNRIFKLVGYEPCNAVEGRIHSITYSKWDSDTKKEVIKTITNDTEHGFYLPEHEVTKTVFKDEDVSAEEKTTSQEEMETNDGDVRTTVTTMSKYKVSGIGWGGKKELTTDVEDLEKVVQNGVTIAYKNPNNKYYYDDDVEGDEAGNDWVDDDENDMHEFNKFKHSWNNYVLCTSSKNLGFEIKLDEYINWIKITLSVTPKMTTLVKEDNENADIPVKQTSTAAGDPFIQTVCFVANPDYLKEFKSSDPDNPNDYDECWNSWETCCRVGLYTHGRSGIYDEINYTDLDPDNQIKPTFWYDKQEPFEFEFVVNTPTGMQKIFENLVLISNDAEPESLEISLIGDAYNFNKAGIFNSDNTTIPHDAETGILNTEELTKEKLKTEFANTTHSQNFDICYNKGTDREVRFHTSVSRDNVLNQYVLNVHEDCRDVKDIRWGKRLGNIEYREDKWLVTLSPIMFKTTEPIKTAGVITGKHESSVASTKLRDKWCKVRIKYKGDKLVVISAIQTLLSLSYS